MIHFIAVKWASAFRMSINLNPSMPHDLEPIEAFSLVKQHIDASANRIINVLNTGCFLEIRHPDHASDTVPHPSHSLNTLQFRVLKPDLGDASSASISGAG
jgi:hypothetical protein